MFARSYFAAAYFAPTYWPPVVDVVVTPTTVLPVVPRNGSDLGTPPTWRRRLE